MNATKHSSGTPIVPPSLLLSVLDAVYGRVERLGVSPVVADGLAVSYWGHPRSTQDIDLAVIVSDDPSFESGLRQANLLPAKGGRIIDLGFVRVSQWKFTLEGEYIDCEIDFLISNSSYHQEAIGRAIACDFPGVTKPVRILSCEDLLLFKAASGRLIDLADIKTLVALHEQTLDYDYLRAKADELRLPTEFWLPA
jgi:hypothetical protein